MWLDKNNKNTYLKYIIKENQVRGVKTNYWPTK